MRELLRESITDYLNDKLVPVTEGDFVRTPVTGVTLRRDDELNLVFELTSRGWSKESPERYPAGTVRSADELIEFSHVAGWVGTARGVIERGKRSASKGAGESETVETYSARSVELDLQRHVQPSYVMSAALPSNYTICLLTP